MDLVIPLSVLKNTNSKRKRPLNAESWNSNEKKRRKNLGESYENSNGIIVNERLPPNHNKVSSNKCKNEGCSLNFERKTQIFEGFWKIGNKNLQTNFIIRCISKTEISKRREETNPELSRRQNSFLYYLPDIKGNKVRICIKTLQDVLGVSEKTIRCARQKLMDGIIIATDLRGRHNNRPRNITEEEKENVKGHIELYPTYISHYGREKEDSETKYLDKSLNPRIMYENFHAIIGEETPKEWYYRQTLRDLKYKFTTPKCDTCSKCDLFEVNIKTENHLEAKEDLLFEQHIHHKEADFSYEKMTRDKNESINNDCFITIAVDLQKVLLSPMLTNSLYFYKQKYSCYNFALANLKDSSTTFSFWHEVIAKRGSAEICSSILKILKSNYLRLQEGQNRKLSVWSDRCVGQNNNWTSLCLYIYLVRSKYFTELEQNFLTTGHSFLQCDREFALIEKRKLLSEINIPKDWIQVIKDAKINNPNEVIEMTREDFLNFELLRNFIPIPTSLKVSQVMSIKYSANSQDKLLTKGSHGDPCWTEHNLNIQNSIEDFQFIPKYSSPILISKDKKKHLVEMTKFLMPECRSFYINLPTTEAENEEFEIAMDEI